MDTLHELLPRDITVFCLDFSGSGKSEGEYISLGHFEEQDLEAVVTHLRSTGHTSAVGLWGRSMGGATAVLRAARDSTLAGCVIDSAFSDLPTVAREVAKKLSPRLPDFLLSLALQSVRGEIQARAQFDIEELLPIRHAPVATSPALFAVAKEDSFIPPHHTYDLHRAWGGRDKKLVTVGGGHDSARPPKFVQYAADWIQERLEAAAAEWEGPQITTSSSSGGLARGFAPVTVDARQVLSRDPRSGPRRPSLGRLSTPACGDCGEDPCSPEAWIEELGDASLQQKGGRRSVCLGEVSQRLRQPRKLAARREPEVSGGEKPRNGSTASTEEGDAGAPTHPVAAKAAASREAVLAVATPMAAAMRKHQKAQQFHWDGSGLIYEN
jgi:dienelactone hydrolase